jgi:hypothetical protein
MIHIQPYKKIIVETNSILNKSDQTEVKEILEIEVPQQLIQLNSNRKEKEQNQVTNPQKSKSVISKLKEVFKKSRQSQ